jgi:hypothetical protein
MALTFLAFVKGLVRRGRATTPGGIRHAGCLQSPCLCRFERRGPMIKLTSDTEAPSRRCRLPRLFVLLVLVAVVALVGERWRGQWALSRWKHRMAAKGELFEPSRIWPQPSAQGLAFSNELHRAVAQFPPGLNLYAGLISGIVLQEPGMGRRGSQEPSPALNPSRDGTNSWQDLALQIHQAQPALQSLQRILTHPPARAEINPGHEDRGDTS